MISSALSSLKRPALGLLSLLLVPLVSACGDEALPVLSGPTLPLEDTTFTLPPSQASADNPEGHWRLEQRSVAFDKEDRLVLRSKTAEINEGLGKVTLNLPLLARQSNETCVDASRAAALAPRAQAESALSALRADGLTVSEVVVNVELLTPKLDDLHHVCLGTEEVGFFSPTHRAHVLDSLKALAELEEVSAITFGARLNSYYHFKSSESSPEGAWDYANLVSLYHEVYDELKRARPTLLVGPGVTWGTLINQTLPSVAEGLELSLEEGAERDLALELALKRSVWSLLMSGTGELKADFVGVSLRPQLSGPPFNGNVDVEPEVLSAYYAELALLGAPTSQGEPLETLPLAFTQMNWASLSGSDKVLFLKAIKEATRHVNPLWVSWLRLSDLPREPAESSICRIYTSAPKNYPESFCSAGLFDVNGQPYKRTIAGVVEPLNIWDLFTTNP